MNNIFYYESQYMPVYTCNEQYQLVQISFMLTFQGHILLHFQFKFVRLYKLAYLITYKTFLRSPFKIDFNIQKKRFFQLIFSQNRTAILNVDAYLHTPSLILFKRKLISMPTSADFCIKSPSRLDIIFHQSDMFESEFLYAENFLCCFV